MEDQFGPDLLSVAEPGKIAPSIQWTLVDIPENWNSLLLIPKKIKSREVLSLKLLQVLAQERHCYRKVILPLPRFLEAEVAMEVLSFAIRCLRALPKMPLCHLMSGTKALCELHAKGLKDRVIVYPH